MELRRRTGASLSSLGRGGRGGRGGREGSAQAGQRLLGIACSQSACAESMRWVQCACSHQQLRGAMS